jgi:RNA polymerase sigma-70 factor (ECF subfamily)
MPGDLMSRQLISTPVEKDAEPAPHVAARPVRKDLRIRAARVRRKTSRDGGRTPGMVETPRESASAHRERLREESAPADEQPFEGAAADPSASGPLYGRYAKLVYGVALAILGSREEAEDLTQDVFVSLCRPTAYDQERGSLTAFVTTMTRSRAIDRLRWRVRSARLLETWNEATPFAQGPTMPCEHVSIRRAVERVRAALAELPGERRQVLEMAYYGGLSQQEIAAELDTPLGTVKSRSRRALLELGHALEDFVA